MKFLLNISQPLAPGFFLLRAQREPTWIQFKFEKVFGFCFNCWRLGHLTNTCLTPPNGMVAPASYSNRMFANSQDYRRFVGPKKVIPKSPYSSDHDQFVHHRDHFQTNSHSATKTRRQGVLPLGVMGIWQIGLWPKIVGIWGGDRL